MDRKSERLERQKVYQRQYKTRLKRQRKPQHDDLGRASPQGLTTDAAVATSKNSPWMTSDQELQGRVRIPTGFGSDALIRAPVLHHDRALEANLSHAFSTRALATDPQNRVGLRNAIFILSR
ncbi:MAG: hypothetical protein ACTHJQ_02870 [Rhizobiaceae bacterium]